MGAVQNAMQRDGLDPTVMDLDHTKSVASQRNVESKKEDEDQPPLKDDPKYQKYFKMLKMVSSFFITLIGAAMQPYLLTNLITSSQGLPMGAVQNAMQRDGLDPTIMDLDHNKSVARQLKKEGENDGPPLKDDPKYQKYFKMLKMVRRI
jgi:hypothetical protein